MYKARILISLSLCILSGCTLMEMNRDSDARARRIPVKQQQLYNEVQQGKALAAEQQQLQTQRSLIHTKEDELNRSLDAVNEQIVQTKAATLQQKRKRQQIEAHVRNIKAESERLKSQPDTEDKLKKLEALKTEARRLLALPLGKEVGE